LGFPEQIRTIPGQPDPTQTTWLATKMIGQIGGEADPSDKRRGLSDEVFGEGAGAPLNF
jgi:hypothetical protein